MLHDLAITNGTTVSPELGTFGADLGIDGKSAATISRVETLEGPREIDGFPIDLQVLVAMDDDATILGSASTVESVSP